MTERPILFSAPMVRAILAGTKTQTRRVVKPQPTPATQFNTNVPHQPGDWIWPYKDSSAQRVTNLPGGPEGWSKHCPYGQPGDRLWVREAHMLDPPIDFTWPSVGDTFASVADIPDRYRSPEHVLYRADEKLTGEWRWRSPIHMPRWASRITLEVTDVRVQRLREINELDALAEGIAHSTFNDPRVEYRWLWEAINGAGAWDANPWVWAVSFERVTP